jgi:hypothetical protein
MNITDIKLGDNFYCYKKFKSFKVGNIYTIVGYEFFRNNKKSFILLINEKNDHPALFWFGLIRRKVNFDNFDNYFCSEFDVKVRKIKIEEINKNVR